MVVSPSSFWAQMNLCRAPLLPGCPVGCPEGAALRTPPWPAVLGARERPRAVRYPPGSAGHAGAVLSTPPWAIGVAAAGARQRAEDRERRQLVAGAAP